MALPEGAHPPLLPAGWGQRALGAGLLLVAVAELAAAAVLLAPRSGPAACDWPRFLVIGDWGRDGDYNQSATADAMAAPLRNEALQLGSMATLIRQDARGWNVAWRNAQGQDDGAFAKHLIVTAPHWQWASLPFEEELKKTFREWERAEAPPVTVVARGYDRSAVAHPLDGFGYLIPGKEKRQILGCLFPSTVLPGRTPEGKVLLCCFIGGARYPALARQTDEQLRAAVDRELAETLGVSGPPEKEWIQRWDRAIPQYGVDQSRREAALAHAEAKNPGLHFHGAFRGGIALMHVIRAGDALGRSLAKG